LHLKCSTLNQENKMQEKQKLTTTLSLLRNHDACKNGYKKLAKFLGKDYGNEMPINLLKILENNGADDCLWSLRATQEDSDKIARLMAADFAESVLHFYTAKYPDDKRPVKAIQAARDYANGIIMSMNCDEASRAAYVAAAHAAVSAGFACSAAAHAAVSAAHAAVSAAHASIAYCAGVGAASTSTSYAAAARAAYSAALAAVAADDAESEKQSEIIRAYLIED
jgi:hypothetical protein